jgi:hypothetical protein
MACYAAFMNEMSDMKPEELASIIQMALTQAASDIRLGRIAAGGSSAGFNLQLPNGQTFRLQLQEVEA